MPRFPDDMAKARAHGARQKAIREKRRAAEEAQAAKDAQKMEEARLSIARKFGIDPSSVTMHMCRRWRA